MNTILLSGHSGCKVMLIESPDHGKYVRKVSADRNYNQRLKNQCLKQAEFKNSDIFTPRILNSGIDGAGLFFFDMEYVQGITLAQYIKTISVNRIRDIVKLILGNRFHADFESNAINPQAEEIFLNKILATEKKVNYSSKELESAFAFLKNYNYQDFQESFCHGDLTLENIIMSNNRIYYIDFLDSFYNSWLIDIAKLLQDVQSFWSYRDEKYLDENLLIRLRIFRDILISYLREIDSKYVEDAYCALLLNLVRIYPYTKDKDTLKFLDSKLQQILIILGGL